MSERPFLKTFLFHTKVEKNLDFWLFYLLGRACDLSLLPFFILCHSQCKTPLKDQTCWEFKSKISLPGIETTACIQDFLFFQNISSSLRFRVLPAAVTYHVTDPAGWMCLPSAVTVIYSTLSQCRIKAEKRVGTQGGNEPNQILFSLSPIMTCCSRFPWHPSYIWEISPHYFFSILLLQNASKQQGAC